MKVYDIIVIGGGASGLAAAAAASLNKHVALLEGNKKLGKKLLATGNGRCNLSNENLRSENYHGDNIMPLIKNHGTTFVTDFFKKQGLYTKADEEGRVYPFNFQAQAVNDTLIRTIENNKADIYLEFTAVSVKKVKGNFEIISEDGRMVTSKKLIIASGGKASGKLSCKLNGYDLAVNLGHSVTKLNPSLVQFISKDKFINSLSGVRVKAEVKLNIENKTLREEKGEVQFTDKGLSGICVMQLSLECDKYLKPDFTFNDKAYLILDLLPEFTFTELFEIIRNTSKEVKGIKNEDLLSGLLNIKIAKQIMKSLNFDLNAPSKGLRDNEIKSVVSLIKSFKITVNGTKGFEDAQVTSGGIPLKEINLETMESKLVKGLYFTGEILNVHGDCGGYNLHFAFTSGIIAGESASEK